MEKFLSGIELYFTSCENISGKDLIVRGEDVHHIVNVMRHAEGDTLHVTDGAGRIFESTISSVVKDEVQAGIEKTYKYENRLADITFCIPRLKSADRFEFALEKCVELGITKFIVFQSARTVAKGAKLERWNKIARAAMKQSLRSYLPEITYLDKFDKLNGLEGEKILLEQNATTDFSEYLASVKSDSSTHYCFIFGPEGGLTEQELSSLENSVQLKLTGARLRSETAVVAAGVIVTRL